MKLFLACVALLLFIVPAYAAEETHTIAIPEFRNKAERIIIVNRWTMAEDLAKFLRKKDDRFRTIKRKDILKAIGEFSWMGDRLTSDQEKAIASLGARYLVYGTIAQWRATSEANNPAKPPLPEATVVINFDVVDLSTREIIQNFTTDGRTSHRVDVQQDDPMDFDDSKHEEALYDATEVALIKAAQEVLQIFALIE